MKIIKYKFRVPGKRQPAASPEGEKKIKKRALLIGVQQVREVPPENLNPGIEKLESGPRAKFKRAGRRLLTKKKLKTKALRGPHRDVKAMRSLLIDVYNYDPADIVTLIDDDDPNHKQPTLENIVRGVGQYFEFLTNIYVNKMAEMRKLVEGAGENDRFFFHFSGHSEQEETDDIEEEDRKNEFIVTSDGGRIKDDTLKETLVDPLPTKASLIAVFDSCFSGTLLDLKHFRCNRVYIPWINKGERRTASLWNGNIRQRAKISTRNQPLLARRKHFEAPWERTSIDHVLATPKDSADAHEINKPKTQSDIPLLSKTKSLSIITDAQGLNSSLSKKMFFDSEERQFLSPVPMYCTGFCRETWKDEQLENLADVMSISSAKDSQKSWEDKNGFSMTSVLVHILRKNPHPTLEDLMTDVSHQIHEFYLDLHDRSREYKKKVRAANDMMVRSGKMPKEGDEVEMNNFQNPQLSSDKPLDMSRRFYP
ncbi:caspase domain-containing protein [Gymnopilus junonius]|uniref:Caspase domain-containing protein n=1 Tax=Gymnopilus junonius TaxID=109634 RepID=A0A9P5NSI9_GYMJU|nr:caspase domain-containing protein [Gymnopilus junonius]